jgi:hypothetical protein
MLVAPRTIASLVLTLLFVAGCGGDGATSTTDSAGAPAPTTAAPPSPPSLTDADMDAYERGMKKEIEAVRAAQQQARTAKDAQQRLEAIRAQWEDATVLLGAPAAGVSVDRYRQVRGAVNEVFKTLDFQGKIDGPLSMDMTRADAATKERLARDAFSDLSSESAAALRARMDQLVPVWVEYVTLTAVAG